MLDKTLGVVTSIYFDMPKYLYETPFMIIQNQHPDEPQILGLYELYHRIDDSTWFVNSPCVLCTGKRLKRGEVYELHNVTNSGAKVIYIKLLWVYLIGFNFYIIGVDVETGELVRRAQRLDNDLLPCNFLIAERFFFIDLANKMENEIRDDEKQNR